MNPAGWSLADDGRTMLRDGRPIPLIVDTAWSGVIRASDADWQRYLQRRREQGFTAITFVAAHWRDAPVDGAGDTAWRDGKINAAFFDRTEARVRMIAEHGLLAMPVLLWACVPGDVGLSLPVDEAMSLACWIARRYADLPSIMLVGGDARYARDIPRWRQIGRSVQAAVPNAILGLHLAGQTWLDAELHDEPWLRCIAFQSGHGDADDHLRWLTAGPPARRAMAAPKLVFNLEPNYEHHPGYASAALFSAVHVRRAAWWSVLGGAPAGIGYGTQSIWVWPSVPEVPRGHPSLADVGGLIQPWHAGIDLPGARSMGVVRRVLERGEWWTLRPTPHWLADQPGETNAAHHVAVAADADERWALLYVPHRAPIPALQLPAGPWEARRIHPATGAVGDAFDPTDPSGMEGKSGELLLELTRRG